MISCLLLIIWTCFIVQNLTWNLNSQCPYRFFMMIYMLILYHFLSDLNKHFNFTGILNLWDNNNGLKIMKKQGSKFHACSVCSYTSYSSSHVKRHFLIHTGQRPFSCTVCSFNCNQKEILKRHMLSQHGVKFT